MVVCLVSLGGLAWIGVIYRKLTKYLPNVCRSCMVRFDLAPRDFSVGAADYLSIRWIGLQDLPSESSYVEPQ